MIENSKSGQRRKRSLKKTSSYESEKPTRFSLICKTLGLHQGQTTVNLLSLWDKGAKERQ